MAELGEAALDYHRGVGAGVRDARVDELIAVGPLAREYTASANGVVAHYADTAADAADALARAAPSRRRRAREGLARGGTRSGCSETDGRLMARVLVGALIALIISLARRARSSSASCARARYGQQIREEGPQHHMGKQGTPTMGGVLIVVAAAIAFLVTTVYTLPALTIFGTMVACGAIGFADDLIKLRHQRSLGLSARWKMLLLLAIAVVVGLAAHHQKLRHDVFVPVARTTGSRSAGAGTCSSSSSSPAPRTR